MQRDQTQFTVKPRKVKMSIRSRYNLLLLLTIPLFLLLLATSGCDFSARWDLRHAEKALKDADNVQAEYWAETEYRKAQKAFDEAVALAHNRNINEARDMAQNALTWAEEAINLSITRRQEMEEERDGLGTYKE